MNMRWLAVSLCLFTGCSSAKTTFLERDQFGDLSPKPGLCRKGVPVMVKVPTHVKVEIHQTDVWRIVQRGNDPRRLVRIPEATSRAVTVEELQIEQMVLLDPKRPASGTGEFAFGFAADNDVGKGILSSVGYKSVDTTLKDSAALLTKIISTFSTPVGAAQKASTGIATDSPDLISAKRIIAYRHFPLNGDTETNVANFVNQYINNCSPGDCKTGPAYAN